MRLESVPKIISKCLHSTSCNPPLITKIKPGFLLMIPSRRREEGWRVDTRRRKRRWPYARPRLTPRNRRFERRKGPLVCPRLGQVPQMRQRPDRMWGVFLLTFKIKGSQRGTRLVPTLAFRLIFDPRNSERLNVMGFLNIPLNRLFPGFLCGILRRRS